VNFDAIVIGAGPNGCAAAALLAQEGRRVLLLDSAEEIGGHTRSIEFAPGFRAPLDADGEWLPSKVEKGIGIGADALRRVSRAHSLSVAASDGELLTLRNDIAAATHIIRNHSPQDSARWPAFVQRLHKFARILASLYQLVPPDVDATSVGELLPLAGVARRVRALGRHDMTEFLRVMPMSIQDLLDDTFETELLKAAIAASALRDLRQGPRSGGTTFNLLHYLVGSPLGAVRARSWFAEGPDAFAKEAARIARTHGAEVKLGRRVERILVSDGTVTGVGLAGGEESSARMVISTADPKRTFLELVDPVWLDPEFLLAVRNVKLRGCTAYVLFAIDADVEDASKTFAGTVSLTPTTVALEKAADAAKYGEVSKEPHVEFFAPTIRWPQLAPPGGRQHVIVARVQYAPYHLENGTWDKDRACVLMEQVTAGIARVIPGFADSILHRDVLTPVDIEQRFGVTEGALTQGELTLDQILFMRPVPGWGHYATPIDGLYLGGAGAHPGPGILGGAGYLAARTALRAT